MYQEHKLHIMNPRLCSNLIKQSKKTKNLFPEDFFESPLSNHPNSNAYYMRQNHPKIITCPKSTRGEPKKIVYSKPEKIIEENSIEESKQIEEGTTTNNTSNTNSNSNLSSISNTNINTNINNIDNFNCTFGSKKINKINKVHFRNNNNYKDINYNIIQTEPNREISNKKINLKNISSRNYNRGGSAEKINFNSNVKKTFGNQKNNRNVSEEKSCKINNNNLFKNKKFPKIYQQTLVKKELNNLINIVNDNCLDDPEINNKFNKLLLNINEFNQSIFKKKGYGVKGVCNKVNVNANLKGKNN